AARGMRRRHEARVHRRSIEQHRAGAALAFAATLFSTRQMAVLTQDVQQPFQRMDVNSRARAIDRERDHRDARMLFSGVAGISRTSKPAWRIALTIAGAGPSIGISPTPLAPNGPCSYGFSRITTSIGGVSSVVGTM